VNIYIPKPGEVNKDWYEVDASGKVLGRLASNIARILMGKHKPIYTPHMDVGDFVIVTNADKVIMTGKKWDTKKYYRHSGYHGGLKYRTADEMREKFIERMIEHAVKGMLPNNKMRDRRIRKLKVYRGAEHPHQAQTPKKLEF